MTRKRKRYSSEFKVEAVRQLARSDKPITQVARELGLKPDLLYRWKREQENPDAGVIPEPGQGSEAAENQRLRRELERVTQERDFLKKAAAYFAQESK
jgi:transposase